MKFHVQRLKQETMPSRSYHHYLLCCSVICDQGVEWNIHTIPCMTSIGISHCNENIIGQCCRAPDAEYPSVGDPRYPINR